MKCYNWSIFFSWTEKNFHRIYFILIHFRILSFSSLYDDFYDERFEGKRFEEKKISLRKRNSQINLLGQCKQCEYGFHPSVTCGIGTLSDDIGTRQETFENGRAYSWLKRVHVKHFTVREEIRFCPSHRDTSDNLLPTYFNVIDSIGSRSFFF